MSVEKLKDKKILVTGATGDIGSAVARQLVASGAQLFITGRNNAKLSALAAELGLSTSQFYACDLTLEEDVSVLAERFSAQYDSPDILVHTAGVGIIKPLEQLTSGDLRQSVETNFYSAFYLLKVFLPGMKLKGKGLIINIPGVLGKTPMAGASVYAASKYALNGFLKSVREELKRTEIRITQLFLGGVDSAFWDTIDLRVQREKMISAEDAAKAVWFLCQQPASGVVSEMVLQPFNHQAI